MRVLIVPNHSNADAGVSARSLASHLASTGREALMLAEDAVACDLPDLTTARDRLGELDLVVALGGDGTMLRAAHAVPDLGSPILGTNTTTGITDVTSNSAVRFYRVSVVP